MSQNRLRVLTLLLASQLGAPMALAAGPDRDRDGIPDDVDGAPLEPEDKDGYEDEDGIPDPIHAAGAAPEGPAEKKGDDAGPTTTNAIPDMDKDGILDIYDLCMKEAEDVDWFEDGDGCPDLDNDQDGIADDKDTCPLLPGSDCKKEAPLVVKAPIVFTPGDARLLVAKSKGLEQLYHALESGQVVHLEIQGHTDEAGDPDLNFALSLARAQAIADYLVKRGVAADRIRARGFGDTKPLVPPTTPANKAKNRRLEFYPAP